MDASLAPVKTILQLREKHRKGVGQILQNSLQAGFLYKSLSLPGGLPISACPALTQKAKQISFFAVCV